MEQASVETQLCDRPTVPAARSSPAPSSPTPPPANGLPPHAIDAQSASCFSHPAPFHYSLGFPSNAVATTPVEYAKRRRGRPRKYETREEAQAARRIAMALKNSISKGHFSAKLSTSVAAALAGNSMQGFIPHIIVVDDGEDVAQKLMLFIQQNRCEVCVLSASGSISSVSLSQPATSGGNIMYEGQFEIISLSGSYVRTGSGGRTGGLSVCLSDSDGQIIGGGVGGLLKAAGSVKVIVGTFVLNNMNDASSMAQGNAVSNKLLVNVELTVPDGSMKVPMKESNDRQHIAENLFVMQPLDIHAATPERHIDWGCVPDV